MTSVPFTKPANVVVTRDPLHFSFLPYKRYSAQVHPDPRRTSSIHPRPRSTPHHVRWRKTPASEHKHAKPDATTPAFHAAGRKALRTEDSSSSRSLEVVLLLDPQRLRDMDMDLVGLQPLPILLDQLLQRTCPPVRRNDKQCIVDPDLVHQ